MLSGSFDIALVGIHVKPDHAVAEIRDLIDVYDDVIGHWPTVKVCTFSYQIRKFKRCPNRKLHRKIVADRVNGN